jgi:crooked neck
MEHQLANIDRVRTIYAKYVECFPTNPMPWIKFAEFENSLEEFERSDFLFNFALD